MDLDPDVNLIKKSLSLCPVDQLGMAMLVRAGLLRLPHATPVGLSQPVADSTHTMTEWMTTLRFWRGRSGRIECASGRSRYRRSGQIGCASSRSRGADWICFKSFPTPPFWPPAARDTNVIWMPDSTYATHSLTAAFAPLPLGRFLPHRHGDHAQHAAADTVPEVRCLGRRG